MNASSDENALLRGYLLATLPEPERLELAARYFSDDELFERLQAAEADLVDDYVTGELAPQERRLFEESLKTIPGRAERLAFARALQRVPAVPIAPHVERPSKPGLRSPYWAAAAIVLLVALAGLWAAVQSMRQQDELRGLRQERDRLAEREKQLGAEVRELRSRLDSSHRAAETGPSPDSPAARTAVFLLTAGLSREPAATNRLRIPSAVTRVRLDLPIRPDPAARYRAVIQRPDGSAVSRRDDLRPTRLPSGPALTLEIPAAELPDGDYVALIEDVRSGSPESVAEFFFRVIR
jgi:hypothetical protein